MVDFQPRFKNSSTFQSSSASSTAADDAESQQQKRRSQWADRADADDKLDKVYGFDWLVSSSVSQQPTTAFLFNIRPSHLLDSNDKSSSHACLDCLFVGADGTTFKAAVPHAPYFYVQLRPCDDPEISRGEFRDVQKNLLDKYEKYLSSVESVRLTDLSQPNHLSGIQREFMKLIFRNVEDLQLVRKELLPIIESNKNEFARKSTVKTRHSNVSSLDSHSLRSAQANKHAFDPIIDIREYDVPYLSRVCIDREIRVGRWYDVLSQPSGTDAIKYQHSLSLRSDLIAPPLIKKCAFDIETSKDPLKFPNAEKDEILMVSLMVDNQGYLIVNNHWVKDTINDFEYSPNEEMIGQFICINVDNEKALLHSFLDLLNAEKPLIYITYNGDFFDWPFIERRCREHSISLRHRIGMYLDKEEYTGRQAVHLDCFAWVKRDSYLPQGSQGLKAVTKAKLKYNPVEVDPEDMLRFASERPQELAAYSVSDAVSTYYLYMKYIHLFIFSLSTIIPMSPGDVLRKGSGTLCESLLQVEAARVSVIAPNKQEEEWEKYYAGRLLDSETYIGGHVECIESGVFRSDIPCKFNLSTKRLAKLKESLDDTIAFALKNELSKSASDVVNLESVRAAINGSLDSLIAKPNIEVLPLIYHLDVGAMYPNIILTNRLQPMAIVNESVCAACDYNAVDAPCQRSMTWKWRGKYYPANKGEVAQQRANVVDQHNDKFRKQQLQQLSQPAAVAQSFNGGKKKFYSKDNHSQSSKFTAFTELPASEQAEKLKAAVKDYSRQVYKKLSIEATEERTAIVCQRENSFYVDTVRAFRDRRYEYKIKGKAAKRSLDEAVAAGDAADRARYNDELLVYDSLQLAHKCILNSFYGYVMRRGARWHSIEMAGIVTNTGAELIKQARQLIEDVGRPLELDTDGIWCMLPATFPDNFTFQFKDGGKFKWSYPCSLLNADVAKHYTNDQYHQLVTNPVTGELDYARQSECSILFEVDGPYKAMILPASREEGKDIKKRYAVFDDDGSLAELKGFELKRRGELKLIKVFQGGLFHKFLEGSNLSEAYAAVGDVCNQWLDVLLSHGQDMEEFDIIELIAESKSMSDTLEEYGEKRSTSITTAKRLGEFLGAEMVKDKGLNCRFVISAKPENKSVSDRAVPVAIFAAGEAEKRHYLQKWLDDYSIGTEFDTDGRMKSIDIRDLVDWSYYIQRLSAAIQKIVTIPAAMQRIPNPVPRVKHPDWLGKRVREREESHQQKKIGAFFDARDSEESSAVLSAEATHTMKQSAVIDDMEDFGSTTSRVTGVKRVAIVRRRKAVTLANDETDETEKRQKTDALDDTENISDAEVEDDNVMEESVAVSTTGIGLIDTSPVPATVPELETDFAAWLVHQKKEWNQEKKEFKKKKSQRNDSHCLSSASTHSKSSRAANLFASLDTGLRSKHGTTASLRNSVWQILQITEDKQPGTFRAWVFLAPATLESVVIRVDRVIFVNSYTAKDSLEQLGARRVTRSLPHGRPSHYLYQLAVSEQRWRDEQDHLTLMLEDPTVENIYESKIPLLFQLIKDIGCCCQLNRAKFNGSGEYPLTALEYRSTGECSYLDSVNLSKIFLYYSASQSSNISLFFLVFEHSRKAHVIVVTPYKRSLEKVKLSAVFAQVAQQTLGLAVDELASLSFQTHEYDSRTAAYAEIKKQLRDERMLASQPPMIVYQSTLSLNELYIDLPWLRADYPVITIPSDSSDNHYPTLGWYSHVVRKAFERYLSSEQWLTQALEHSRYSHVPIGNLNVDRASQALDLVYARTLSKRDYLLWWTSEDPYQAGGTNTDNDTESLSIMGSIKQSNPWNENSGCYRSVSVEFNLYHLCLCAVRQSADIETESGVVVDSAMVSDSFQSSAPNIRPQFELFKSMIERLINDCHTSLTSVPSQLLYNDLYRWLHSPYSPLRDALLTFHIQSLMIQYHTLLLNKLQSLGDTRIIHSSFDKLIIDTRKNDSESAERHARFLRITIRDDPLFQGLDFRCSQGWHSLIYVDRSNWSGIYAKLNYSEINREKSQELTDSDASVSDSGMSDGDIVQSWTMSQFLPQRCAAMFEDIVCAFLFQPHQHRHQPQHQRQSLSKTKSKLSHINNVSVMDDDYDNVNEVTCCDYYLRALLHDDIANTLFSFLHSVHYHLEWPLPSDRQPLTVKDYFPVLPGLNYAMKSPALEFTKQIVHVLSLDDSVKKEVRSIRENLFRILAVPAFSPLTTFVNPSARIAVLPDLCCRHCGHCEDVDLGQRANSVSLEEQRLRAEEQQMLGLDSHVKSKDALMSEEAAVRELACSACHQSFDRTEVDDLFLHLLERQLSVLQREDLQCVNCGRQQDRYLLERCPCGGRWRTESEGVRNHATKWPILNRLCLFFGLLYSHSLLEFLCQSEGMATVEGVTSAETASDGSDDSDEELEQSS